MSLLERIALRVLFEIGRILFYEGASMVRVFLLVLIFLVLFPCRNFLYLVILFVLSIKLFDWIFFSVLFHFFVEPFIYINIGLFC